MHNVPCARHPSYQKTLTTIKTKFYWAGMNKETTKCIPQCLDCQGMKVEHKHSTGLLHLSPVLEWKWDVVAIDFITKFPRAQKKHDSIMVVVDKLTNSTHLVVVQSTFKETNIT